MKMIIDRFEGEYAVVELENGEIADFPKVFVPQNAAEGDTITIEAHRDEDRRKKINKLAEEIFK